MIRTYNDVGFYCVQTCQRCGHYDICEHNLRDASITPMNVCSGIGGRCNRGSAFSCVSEYCKKERR